MKNRIFTILGALLIICSAFWIFSIKQNENKKRADALEAEKQFVQSISIDEEKNESQEDVTLISNDIEEDDIERDDIQSDQAIAVLRIDKLNLLAQVFDNTKSGSLYDGVGVIESTDLPSSKPGTTCAIAGHRGGVNEELSFLNIDKLEFGDEIKITTKDEVLVYKVTGSEIIEPDDWSKFTREEDKSKLVLMTCHPYPTDKERLLVYSELQTNED
ncbi:MAG: class C sortase [Ezakiella sp.]|uniref:class C sortase n=1 Tax=Ezakiella sp. TaxID=1935205 RepID=UPI00297644A8|nr:class C sortase [Ezakiella sp.]MDD7731352.1 class C sortase [Eubacteriales bacterium]MDY6080121.1 class C sortase [Ezakiella sp.]